MLPIKFSLPDDYLNSETRCGYRVSEKLKKIWAVELDLFQELSRVCKKHGIQFHLCFGTLLGAIRHGGFIPWDDDFDVWMTRKDIEKLNSVANEFQHPYFLQTPLSDRRYFSPLFRLRNSETTGAITGFDTPDFNNGIYVDIYALDGLTDSRIKCIWQNLIKRIFIKFLTLYYQRGPRKQTVKEILFYLLKPFSRLLSYEKWNKLYDWTLAMYSGGAAKLSWLVNGNWAGKWWHVTPAELNETIYVDFEHLKVPVPKAYHQILTRTYGDYMQFPPASERGKWHEGIIHFEPEIPYKEYLKNHQG